MADEVVVVLGRRQHQRQCLGTVGHERTQVCLSGRMGRWVGVAERWGSKRGKQGRRTGQQRQGQRAEPVPSMLEQGQKAASKEVRRVETRDNDERNEEMFLRNNAQKRSPALLSASFPLPPLPFPLPHDSPPRKLPNLVFARGRARVRRHLGAAAPQRVARRRA